MAHRPQTDTRGHLQAPTAAKKKQPKVRLGRIDMPMLTIILVLLMFGLVMLYSASYANGLLRHGDSFSYIRPQALIAVVGVVAMLGVALIDYRIWRKFAVPLLLVTLLLLVVVLFMAPSNGARRWIWLDPNHRRSFQPSEVAKFAVILMFAGLIARHPDEMKTIRHGALPFFAILGVVAGLLLAQPHLSCTILVFGIGLSMMFAGGARISWFVLGLAGAAALLYIIYTFPDLLSHASKRIIDWQESMINVEDMEYQTYQSLVAVGSGGVTGRGIGQSRQKFLYLPEMHNDYIFAVLCEELGMVGAIATMVLFLAFLARGLYISIRVKDKFGSMLAVGISVQVALQAFLHMAVNINAIPSTGISMPFFSSGGTSLLILLGQMGILLSVSRGMDPVERRAKRGSGEEESAPAPQPQVATATAQGAPGARAGLSTTQRYTTPTSTHRRANI